MPTFTDLNPYGSREAIVEDDGRTVYLYLVPTRPAKPEAGMKAVWIANRGAAPDAHDTEAMQAGLAPRMPRDGTRQPEGRPPVRAEELEFVWFEEGEGVALLERGVPLAVIPGWAGADGCHGYARDAIGQQGTAWELAGALESLGPRIERARRYWHWRSDEASWDTIRDAGMRHLEQRLGSHQRYWAADGGAFPPRAVALFRPEASAGISVCATIGMSAQPMPQVEQYFEDPAPFRRIELALATTGDPAAAASLLSGMMGSPWQNVTWLGEGHTYSWDPEQNVSGAEAALLLREPLPDGKPGLFRRAQPAPDLSGLADRSGDPVTYLWVLPLTSAEQELAQERGSQAVLSELQRRRQGWVWRSSGR